MTRFNCKGCGKDCSRAYGTHNGYPYHFECFPMPPKTGQKRRGEQLPSQYSSPRTAQQATDAQWLKDNGWSGKQ